MFRRSVRLIGIVLLLGPLFVTVRVQVSLFQNISEGAGEATIEETVRDGIEVAMSPPVIAAQTIGIVLLIASFFMQSKPRRHTVSFDTADNRDE